MGKVVVCLTCLALGQAVGTPVRTIEDGVLDKMVLYVETLDNPTSVPVVMRPFDASMADLGTGDKGGKETRQEEARTMQSEGPRVLAERFATALQNSGPFKSVRVLKVEEEVPEGAVLVEGKFVTLDPGSRAKRFLAGFGAGKSSVKVVGSVKGSTGRTLATFEQRRIGAVGIGGGDSLGKLMSDSRSIGEDIAKFLGRWGRGDSLD